MPALHTLTPEALDARLGRPDAPLVVDVRTPDDFDTDRRLVPGSVRRSHEDAGVWTRDLPPGPVVVVCQKGLKLSWGVQAWAARAGASASVLEGGFEAWRNAGLPLVPSAALPPRSSANGATVWVTRQRPVIDRIACPWLIRRFVDRDAVFLFVPPSEVLAVAERFGATPFDVPDIFWTHRGERCTFDLMVSEFGLGTPAMLRVADIVRGADTARLDLAPESAGLLAMSLGLSRLWAEDMPQLDAGLSLYDALWRWSREAVGETHSWQARAA